KVSESDTFIQLSERYSNLSPLVQKVLLFTLVFFVGYLIYSVPAGFIDSAKEKEMRFTESRQLIRGLTRSARNPVIDPTLFIGLEFEEMRAKIDEAATKIQVLDSQKGTAANALKPLPTNVVPSAIKQNGLTYEFKKLTLRQAVAMSEQISSLHANTKLAGVVIEADKEDNHYFTVKYTLSSLSLPLKNSQQRK
ncbi:MAG: hypothetical protein IT287_00395, partial [Bdellovibrionaceae bacterium]|nr:hypothetical protein [Pseudobdellovibrionaceae bacterium]